MFESGAGQSVRRSIRAAEEAKVPTYLCCRTCFLFSWGASFRVVAERYPFFWRCVCPSPCGMRVVSAFISRCPPYHTSCASAEKQKGCGRFHDWRLALRLLESMEEEGLLASDKNYIAALRACGSGEAEIAGILLEMMRKQGLELDLTGRAAALVAFGRGGRADKALALMDDMRENGPSPTREWLMVSSNVFILSKLPWR